MKEEGKTYHAVIEAIHSDGRVSGKSPEIQFVASDHRRSERASIPIDFQAKVLWHNVNRWLQTALF